MISSGDVEDVNLVKELGHIYAVALAERGHDIDSNPPLLNGLAAYYMLELKGENNILDESIDTVERLVYKGLIARL